MTFWAYLIASFAIVAFGQSAWVPSLSIAAAAFGYALFWRAMLFLSSKSSRFWLSVGWFAAVQAVQISWMTSSQYMGPLIFLVYALLIFAMGLQFGVLSFFFDRKSISLRGALAAAGCWVLMEWSRILPLSGFTWNPAALALANSPEAIQCAALFGVYGLSFWVIFVNALALYASKSWKKATAWGLCAAFPYLFGLVHQAIIEKTVRPEKIITAALVQTALLPEQKDFFAHRSQEFIPPLNQWQRIWESLRDEVSCDLIVLPEAAVSMGAYRPFYPLKIVEEAWRHRFGAESLSDFPPLKPPFASLEAHRGRKIWKVTNAFLATALANHFQTSVIGGFEDVEGNLRYNAAFHFQPTPLPPQRVEKRILVPVGEYIPFSKLRWLARFVADQFGIGDSFDTGTEAKLFLAQMPVGVSICLEETYSDLIRDLRLKGARLFVNVTNDVWFPYSRLPEQHFQHGRLRAAEHGVYVLRSCNTGVTGGIDCFGKVIAALAPSEINRGVLYVSFPLRTFPTLYTWWGDWAIFSLSFLAVVSFLRKSSRG